MLGSEVLQQNVCWFYNAIFWLDVYVECIQEGLWRHSSGRPFFFEIGLKKEAKGHPFFWYPTGFLNTFNVYESEMRDICTEWTSFIWFSHDAETAVQSRHIISWYLTHETWHDAQRTFFCSWWSFNTLLLKYLLMWSHVFKPTHLGAFAPRKEKTSNPKTDGL